MDTENLFHLEVADDGSLSVEFSEEFKSLSIHEQIEAVEALLSKRVKEPFSTDTVSEAEAMREISILFTENLLAQLKRGGTLEESVVIDIGSILEPDPIV